MADQLGAIINGIVVGNFINPHAMAAGSSSFIAIAAGKRDNDGVNYIFTTVVTISVFFGMLRAFLLIPNIAALSIFFVFRRRLERLGVHEYPVVFVWRVPM